VSFIGRDASPCIRRRSPGRRGGGSGRGSDPAPDSSRSCARRPS